MLLTCRQRQQGRRDDEAGFTLIELIVAMIVISTILLGLLAVQTSALSTVTLSRERQQATDLANRTMEQLRALPYATLTAGSLTGDPTLTADPDVTAGRYRPVTQPAIDEVLVTGGAANCPDADLTTAPEDDCPPTPLYPHVQQSADTKIGHVQFRVATYVTLASGTVGDTSDGYRLTVVVTWSSPRTGGATKRVTTRTQAFLPTGCLSTATHPFSGPCQAYFDANAGTAPSGITITTDAVSGVALAGNPLTSAGVTNPGLTAVVQAEQIVSTQSTSTTSQARATTSTGDTLAGAVAASTSASTDPATGGATAPADDLQNQGGADVTTVGTGSSFHLKAGSTDSVRAASTSAAAASAAGCRTVADVSITSGQVCSSGQADQGGPLRAELSYGSTFPLASVEAAAAPSRAVVARFTAPGGPYCAAATGVGCIAADLVRSAGAAQIGGAPSGATGLPSGFSSMVSVSGFSARATAESGVGTAAPSASRTGTLRYWTAAGAVDLDLATSGAQNLSLEPVSYTATGPDGLQLQVTMSGAVVIGAPSSIPSGASPCQPTACGVDVSSGSVIASVTYDITDATSTLVGRFTVDLDLGAATARTSYKADPSA